MQFRTWLNQNVLEMAWGDPISDSQQRYIFGLTKVWVPNDLNRKQASEIIDLAKNGNIEQATQLATQYSSDQPSDQPPSGQPRPQVQPYEQPQMTRPQAKGPWSLSRAVGNLTNDRGEYFLSKQNDDVVILSERPDGNWNVMNRAGEIIVKTNQEVRSGKIAKSERHGEKPIQSYDPEELFAQIDEREPSDDDMRGFEPPTDDMSFRDKNERPKPEGVRIPNEKMTQFNKAIDTKFTQTDKSIMMAAGAGTGKTTMLKHLASYIQPGEKWLYLVFNKKNQLESQNEFPKGVDVMTTHAFLGKLLKTSGKEVGGKTDLPPEGAKWQKIYKVADSMIPLEWPESEHNYFPSRGANANNEVSPFNWKAKSLTTKLTSLSKAFALDPSSPSIANDINEIVQKYNIDTDLSSERFIQERDFTPDIIEKVVDLLKATLPGKMPPSLGQEYANYRDQDDTLWYAALYADQINWNLGYKVVLMDEVQDFNMCQLIMSKKLKEAGARVVGVGDENQAMYLFRGADSEAFEKLKHFLTGGEDAMPLPINFRSGSNIIEFVRQNTHVKDLQAAPHMEGKGTIDTQTGYEDFLGNLQNEWEQQKGKLKEPTAIICRTNAPLAKAALHFLKTGVDFQIIGKDLSRELTQHIKKVTWNKPEMKSVEELPDLFGEYLIELQDKWANKISKRDELKEIEEITETLIAVLHFLAEKDWRENEKSKPIRNGREFMQFIEKKLSGIEPGENYADSQELKKRDQNSFVTLTTAHKSKGLEYDRIMVLNPSAFNPEGDKIRTEAEAQQERNAWYVALTRAKNTLHIAEEEKKAV